MSDFHPLVTGELPPGYSAQEVLNSVITNLLRDANLLAEQDMLTIAASRRKRGWRFEQEDYDALRKAALENIVQLFADRLVRGLCDEAVDASPHDGDTE
jgi:hypothetical protein